MGHMDKVVDDEVLYRNVRPDRRRYAVDPDGTLHITSEAFLDPRNSPSVDRANLCDNNPNHTQVTPDDGVTSLLTLFVRSIQEVGKHDKRGNLVPPPYVVDVHADPIVGDSTLRENLAHAIIVTTPKCNDNEFKKLRRSLARHATERGWMIKPKELRSPGE